MGEKVELTSKDGFEFGAYLAKPSGTPRGGLVLIQEIFGVNSHIRSVVDRYASNGYETIAPFVYDRAVRDYDVGYGPEETDRGRKLREEVGMDKMLFDIEATCEHLKPVGKVGLVGYCLGGSLAWMTACQVPGFSGVVGYYGGMIPAHANEEPKCPVMLHFGEEDKGIPLEGVENIRQATVGKDVEVFTYPGAGHAFNRDGNHAYHEPSAKLAESRTLAFFEKTLG